MRSANWVWLLAATVSLGILWMATRPKVEIESTSKELVVAKGLPVAPKAEVEAGPQRTAPEPQSTELPIVAPDPAAEDPLVVAGTVRTVDGPPTAGALVEVFGSWSDLEPLGVATADADGRFRLSISRRSTGTLRVSAWAPGHRRGQSLHRVDATDHIETEIKLSPGGVLVGRVIVPLQTSARGGRVMITAEHDRYPRSTPVRPDHTYEVDLTSAGTYRISARFPGVGVSKQQTLELDLAEVHRCDLVLQIGGELAGVVVDVGGRPVPGQSVTSMSDVLLARQGRDIDAAELSPAWPEGYSDLEVGGFVLSEVETDDAGRFSLRGLRPGRHALFVFRPEGPLHWVFRTDRTDIRLVIDAYQLVVRAVDPTGQPVHGIELGVLPLDPASSMHRGNWRQVPEGVARFDVLPSASYRVDAMQRARGWSAQAEVTIDPGSRETELRLDMRSVGRGSVVIEVTDDRSEPVDWFDARIRMPGTPFQIARERGRRGIARIDLPPGPYDVRVARSLPSDRAQALLDARLGEGVVDAPSTVFWAEVAESFTVEAAVETTLSITLPTCGILAVRVPGDDEQTGTTYRNIDLRRIDSGRLVSARFRRCLAGDGALHLCEEALAPGRYRFDWEDGRTAEVDIHPDRLAVVELDPSR